jgi:hypothetical protein
MTVTHGSFVRAKSEIPRAKPRRLALANTTFTCFNCNKLRHIAKDCLKSRKGDLKEIKEEPIESYDGQDKDLRKEEL